MISRVKRDREDAPLRGEALPRRRERSLHEALSIDLGGDIERWLCPNPRDAAIAVSSSDEEVESFVRSQCLTFDMAKSIVDRLREYSKGGPRFLIDWAVAVGKAICMVHPGSCTYHFPAFVLNTAVDRNDLDLASWALRQDAVVRTLHPSAFCAREHETTIHSLEMFNLLYPATKDLMVNTLPFNIAVCSRDARISRRFDGIDVRRLKSAPTAMVVTPRTKAGLALYLRRYPKLATSPDFVKKLCLAREPDVIREIASPANITKEVIRWAAGPGCMRMLNAVLEKGGSILTDEEREQMIRVCKEASTSL